MTDQAQIKDAQDTIKYNFIQARRLYRDQVHGELTSLFNSVSDTINSFMRAALGTGYSVFTLSASICSQWKKKCYRKGTEPNEQTVVATN